MRPRVLPVLSLFVSLSCAGEEQQRAAVQAPRSAAKLDRPAVAPSASARELDERQIKTVVEAKTDAVRGCHTLQFVGREASAGTITVDFRINPDGSVASCEVSASTFADRHLEQCVVGVSRELRFPHAQTPTEFSWRFKFRAPSAG